LTPLSQSRWLAHVTTFAYKVDGSKRNKFFWALESLDDVGLDMELMQNDYAESKEECEAALVKFLELNGWNNWKWDTSKNLEDEGQQEMEI